MMLASLAGQMGKDVGRNARFLRGTIQRLQASFTAVDKCRKPVLAAVQGYCIGGAIDLISACDMRYCSSDAQFSIKEIDMGMAADVGTLQRLPRIIGDGIMRELAFTGRNVAADEALRIGLVNRSMMIRPHSWTVSLPSLGRLLQNRRSPWPAPRKCSATCVTIASTMAWTTSPPGTPRCCSPKTCAWPWRRT